MEKSALPVINPPYARTATGAHVVGVLDDPADQVGRVTEALVDGAVRLSEISVFGRHRALKALDPEIDPAYRLAYSPVRSRRSSRWSRPVQLLSCCRRCSRRRSSTTPTTSTVWEREVAAGTSCPWTSVFS